MTALFTIILALTAACGGAATYSFYKKLDAQKKRNKKMLDSYNSFDPANGIRSATEAAATYMRATGTKIYNSFTLSHSKALLTPANDAISIPLNEKSTPVKAFFTLTCRPLDEAYDRDRQLIERYGKKAWLIPLAQAPGKVCWKIHGCQKSACLCHGTEQHHCWLKSGKNHHTATPRTYAEKERKCMRCPSFLPTSLLIGHGKGIIAATAEANTAFGPLLKTASQTMWQNEKKATDPLTGTSSPSQISTQIEPIYNVCRHHDIPLSICAFEVDNPNGIIEHYGIYILQLIIQQTIAIVTPTLKPADICGKLEDESTVYLIIMPNKEKKDAIRYADDLREAITKGQYLYTDKQGSERSVMVRISAGISELHTDETDDHEHLITAANTALYNAKTHKNKVLPYTDQLPKPPDKKSRKNTQEKGKTKKKSANLRDIIE